MPYALLYSKLQGQLINSVSPDLIQLSTFTTTDPYTLWTIIHQINNTLSPEHYIADDIVMEKSQMNCGSIYLSR